MRVSAYAYTNRGGRDHNEDSSAGPDRQPGDLCPGGRPGGPRRGEVASALAVDAIFTAMTEAETLDGRRPAGAVPRPTRDPPPAGEARAGGDAHHRRGAGLTGRPAVWAHIGDSRLYRFSGGQLAGVTGPLRHLPEVPGGRDLLYGCVPRRRPLPPAAGAGQGALQAGGGAGERLPGDAFLLCSDGFWEFVYSEEMQADLCRAAAPEDWAESMLLRHIRRTPPENDNFSLITVFAEEEP